MSAVTNKLSTHALFIYLLLAFSLLGCGGGGGGSTSSNTTPQLTLDSLSLTTVSSILKVADTFQLNVTGTYSDSSTQNLDASAVWGVADESVLTVSSAGLVTAVSAGTTAVTASVGGLSVQTNVSVKALADLSISPTSLTLVINSTQQLSVTGRYTDNSTEVFDSQVTWVSSNPSIASVSTSGEVLAISAGTVSITSSSGGASDSIEVIVLPSLNSLSLTTVSSTLKVADTFQLNVTGTYSDSSTQNLDASAVWGVADESVLTVSSAGLVTAVSAGTTTVTASVGGLSVQTDVSVKALADLSISPTSLTLAINSTQQLSVTGRYTDNNTEAFDSQVTWVSSNPSIASVSTSGEVLAISAGNSEITASALNIVSSALNVTVSPASLQSISVNSSVTQVATGLTTNFSAKGHYSDGSEQDLSDQVVWSVSNNAIADIDISTGVLFALQAGTVSVIATKEGKSGSFDLTVSPATLTAIAVTPSTSSLAKGTSLEVNVTAIFSDNSKQDVSNQVIWSNTSDEVASIEENSFVVSALAEGTTTFTASLSGQTVDLLVNVTDAELVSLALSPVNASIPLGLSQQYQAQGTYTDGSVQDLSSQVTWLSSNESQVLISNNESLKGLADTVSVGTVTLTAVLGDIQQTTTLIVENAQLNSIEIQPANQTVANGTDAQVKAFGYYSDGSKIDLTSTVLWNTSNSNFVDVLSASDGVIHTRAEGSALISADLEGVSGLANISVSAATLQSILISTEKTNLPSGMSQTLVATGTYSDATTKDLSQQVTWQSSNGQIATVSNNSTESGLLRAVGPGQVTVSADLGLISDQIDIDVTNAVLTGVQINTVSTQLNVSLTLQATATATYTDATTQDVTSQVNWLSSDVNIASIGNGVLDKGEVKALLVGVVNLSASLNDINSASVQLEVTLNPNLPKTLKVSVQPNIILNNGSDAAQVNLVLAPSADGGVIADGTPVNLTITEGNNSRIENLVTTNGSVSYSLQSSYDGFISLSASSGELLSTAGLLSSDQLSDAILFQAQSSTIFDNSTLREGSILLVLIRNLSNREFTVDGIAILEGDPSSLSNLTHLAGSPVLDANFLSGGILSAGEVDFFGYELAQDVPGSIFSIIYGFSDQATSSSFSLGPIFRFE